MQLDNAATIEVVVDDTSDGADPIAALASLLLDLVKREDVEE